MNLTFQQPAEDQALIEIELSQKELNHYIESAKSVLNTDDEQQARQYVIQQQANEALNSIIMNEKLKLASQPKIETKEVDGDFIIEISCEIIPDVELGTYKGLNVKKEAVQVSDEEVLQELMRQVASKKTWETMPSDYAAKEGDQVIIDFIGEKDGVPFEGGSGKAYPLVLGSASFIPGFEDQLIGIKANETRDVKVTFPENYFEPSLAGQPVVFHVSCQAVEKEVLPELTDDFIEKLEMSGIKTVEQLRERIHAEMMALKEQEANGKAISEVLEKIIEASSIKIPDSLIKNQINQYIAQQEAQLQPYGLNLAQYLEMTNQKLEDLEEAVRPNAIKDIQAALIIEAVAESEKIEVEQEEIDQEYKLLSSVYNMPAEQLKAFIPVGNVTMQILQKKTLDYLAKENIQ